MEKQDSVQNEIYLSFADPGVFYFAIRSETTVGSFAYKTIMQRR